MRILNTKKTGKILKSYRMKNNFSVKDLSRKLGLAQVQSVYKYEYGVQVPTIDRLMMMADIYHCRVDDLLGYDDEQAMADQWGDYLIQEYEKNNE